MKNKASHGGFLRGVLIFIAAIFIINALGSGRLLQKIESSFSPSADASSCVHDNAGVISAETEEYFAISNASLESQTGAEIIIVTLSALNGADIADKAYEYFSEYAPGDKEKGNGVLLLFSTGDGKYCALQGRGIEDSLSAGTLQLMLNENTKPAFDLSDYESGIRAMFDAVTGHFEKLYSITVSDKSVFFGFFSGGGLFDKIGEFISGITGIAKSIIKTAARLCFGIIGAAIGIVLIAVGISDKKKKDGANAPPTDKKENKNPYSTK